jgi:hypothetical protein
LAGLLSPAASNTGRLMVRSGEVTLAAPARATRRQEGMRRKAAGPRAAHTATSAHSVALMQMPR